MPLASACRMSSPCRFFRHSLLQQGVVHDKQEGVSGRGGGGISQRQREGEGASAQALLDINTSVLQRYSYFAVPPSIVLPLTRRRLPGGAPPRSWGGCR